LQNQYELYTFAKDYRELVIFNVKDFSIHGKIHGKRARTSDRDTYLRPGAAAASYSLKTEQLILKTERLDSRRGADLRVLPLKIKIEEYKMKKENLKEEYHIPRMEVRGIVLEGDVIAVSSRIAINTGDVEYVDYDHTVTEMRTEAGRDFVIF
jgi:hypothetical protein